MTGTTGLCALCRAVNEEAIEVRRVYDTHILSSDSFVVIPAVGPITPGHVMVVSRSHAPNLAALGRATIQEYESLVESMAKHPQLGNELLEAEHGASGNESGGACITHAHVNLIPGFSHLADVLDGNLPRLEVDHDLQTLEPAAAPYILLRGHDVVRLFKAQAVPSQLIRRVLFEKVGRDDWDWAVYPNHSVVEQTLKLWGQALNG